MHLNVRKLVVGLLALALLLGVYLGYTRVHEPPPPIADISPTAPEFTAKTEAAESKGEVAVGTIAGVGIGRIQQTKFIHRNELNEVDRVFGFVELRNQQGDQWDISHPYMTLFFPALRCDVTADRGIVRVETAFGRPMANDAQFSGNVVIHIAPTDPNDLLECFIHLDDVGFLAEKSLFTSSGAVRFFSRIAQLTGTGMELLYDAPRSRLELFRVFDLESLRLRGSEFGGLTGLQTQRPAAEASIAPVVQVRTAPMPGRPMIDFYECIFRGNVAVRASGRLLAARDFLKIDNIPRDRSKERPRPPIADPNAPEPLRTPGADALNTAASAHSDVMALPEEAFDIVVTCDSGFAITPMGASTDLPVGQGDTLETSPASDEVVASPGRQHIVARRVDLNAMTNDATLAGPVEMLFLIDPNGRPNREGGEPVPVTVTAQERVRFLAAANRILLEGGCTIDSLQNIAPNLRNEYHLAAPRLALDLVPDPNANDELGMNVRKFVADGGPVALRVVRRGADGLLGWTRVEAWELQYSLARQDFAIVGPGYVWLHNAEADPNADPNVFSLRRPCYARLSNFDTLTYSAADGRIVAEDEARQLLLDYFPLEEGGYERHITVVAGHVEMTLAEVSEGRRDLAALTASEGIEYEDETNYFIGSRLVYDHNTSGVTVRGDDLLPCKLNEALVDEIELNLKTGRLKTKLPGPSVLQVHR